MRRKRVYKRDRKPDSVYDSIALGRFINYVMESGKKTAAEKVVYGALSEIEKKAKKDPMKVFEKAIENVTPSMEVKSRRVGGANYQIPMEVRPERKFYLASTWIIDAARSKKGASMAQKLADEMILAEKNEGEAVKKKQSVHRMAEANRAFAHFAK